MSKEAPAKAGGVFGDFSNPDQPYYYVRCPVCDLVHGDFKDMREAHAKKLCSSCNIDVVNKLKDQVVDVIANPDYKPKKMSKIIGEAIDTRFNPFDDSDDDKQEPAELGIPVPPETELEADFDPGAEIQKQLFGNWVDIALHEFFREQGVDEDRAAIDKHVGDYDPDDKELTTHFQINIGNSQWQFFKDESYAENAALEHVIEDLKNEPSLFSQEWLSHFIDEDKLIEAIGNPNDGWDEEIRDLDYHDLLEMMILKDEIESDDPLFFDADGFELEPNDENIRILNEKMESYIESNAPPPPDPWEWLNDIYGEDEAIKSAINLVGFNIDAAAESAIRTDGWIHFMSSYDENYQITSNGAVYFMAS